LLYSSTKDMLNAFVGEKRRFDKPVLVSLTADGSVKIVGFLTADSLGALGAADYATVYMPQSYGFAGHIIVVPASRVTRIEADARHHTFLFAIDDEIVIDAAVDGNAARFINHSCDPNCDAIIENDRIWIETIRDVEPGEELAYDYAYELTERHSPAAKRRFP